jgi:hypothetical protein
MAPLLLARRSWPCCCWRVAALAALAAAAGAPAVRTTGEVAASEWVDDALSLHSLGHHRVRLRCPTSDPPAVLATPEWRRPDDFPASHGVYITTDPTTAAVVAETVAVNVSRLGGAVAFDTRGGGGSHDDPGEFFLYWLPFTKNHAGQWGAIAVSYDAPKATATKAWAEQYVDGGKWERLPRCTAVAYESRDEFNRFTAMEVVSTAAEMARVAGTAGAGSPFLVFPEDRDHPVRDFERLPSRWLPLAAAEAAGRCVASGSAGTAATAPSPRGCGTPLTFKGTAQPGEYYVFQLVVWAQAAPLADVSVDFEPLQSLRDPLRRRACAASDFTGEGCMGVPRLDTTSMHSVNNGGVSYLGVPFTKQVNVSVGKIQPMYVALDMPTNLSAGCTLSGTFTVRARNSSTGTPLAGVAVGIEIAVVGPPVSDHGDGNPAKLTRLRWLDSTEGIDDEPTMNFGPLSVLATDSGGAGVIGARIDSSVTLAANNKTFRIDTVTGLPQEIAVDGAAVLAAPIEFQTAVSGAGGNVRWCPAAATAGDHFQWTKQATGVYQWRAQAVACGGGGGAPPPPLRLTVNGSLFFDGFLDYTAELACGQTAAGADAVGCPLQGVTLLANFSESATKYAMGMGNRAQPWPPNASEWPTPSFPSPLPAGDKGLEWRWAEAANATAHGVAPRMGWSAWVGSTKHGLRLKLKGRENVWDGPLNPIGVCDSGTHTCDGVSQVGIPASSWAHGAEAKLALDRRGVLRAASDGRTIPQGASLQFRFDLVTTPAKPRDPQHWHWRYLMGCGGCDVAGAQMDGATKCTPSPSNFDRKVENMSLIGFNIAVIHQGCPLNPFINWPFDVNITRELSLYTAARHARNQSVQMYYTVRELSNRAAELPVLRSLGSEVLVPGNVSLPGGLPPLKHGAAGVSWLQEHLRHDGSGYKTGWTTDVRHNLTDAAVQNYGPSRWANYYIAGMKRMACFPPHVDGVELDGLAYPRHTTQRLRKVTEECRGAATVLNEHVSDDFKGEGIAGMLKYMEHFTFVDSLVTGEVFDYTGDPWYYLLELSGIPFGIMSDLWGWGAPPHGNPNLFYGMVVGMTARMPNGPGINPVEGTWRLWDALEIDRALMRGWWEDDCPVVARFLPNATSGELPRAPIKATAYVQRGEATFIAVASWSNTTEDFVLEIDWPSLGLDAATTVICAPQVENVQRVAPGGAVPASGSGLPVAVFKDGQPIEVQAHNGWWLLLTTRPILECNGTAVNLPEGR